MVGVEEWWDGMIAVEVRVVSKLFFVERWGKQIMCVENSENLRVFGQKALRLLLPESQKRSANQPVWPVTVEVMNR